MISDYVSTFLLNALWQIVVIVGLAIICAKLMRRAPARYLHLLWVATLFVSFLLPLLSVGDFKTFFGNKNSGLIGVLALPVDKGEINAIATVANDEIGALTGFSPRRTKKETSGYAAALIWFVVGCYAVFVSYRLFGLWRAWRQTADLRLGCQPCVLPAATAATAKKCQSAFELDSIEILFSPQITIPAVLGARRPKIILPEDFLEDCSPEMLLATLGHEMAHISRRDYAFNLIYEILFVFVSFHPATTFVKRQISRTRELSEAKDSTE